MYESTTEQLAELVARKHRVLTCLRDLGRRQAELIERNEIDVLLKLLSGKQRLLDELLALDGRLAPFREQDPDRRRWASDDDRARCSEVAADCERMLRQIVQQERESEQAMIRCRDETAARIDGSHKAVQVHGAYFGANQSTASSLDLSSGT
ncbi:MAG: hypothetical protein WD030_07350 [Pirellulales bacterium]